MRPCSPLLAFVLAFGCTTSTPAPDKKPAMPPKHPDTRAAARTLVERFIAPGANHRALTAKLKPREKDYAHVFRGSAAERARRGYQAFWSVAEEHPIRPRAHHTRVTVWQSTTDGIKAGEPAALEGFPAAYKRIADQLASGLNLYRFRFESAANDADDTKRAKGAKDKKPSLAFDGLYNIDGRWVLMPQPWRALAK